jgi:hypothetical protein
MTKQLKIGLFFPDTRANVAMIFALGAPMLVGAAALSVETSYDYWKHTHLQAVADSAAYAGALELRSGASDSAVEDAAKKAATENGWVESGNTIEVNTPPTSGAHTNAQAVEVKISEKVPRFFTAFFVSSPVIAKSRSVAVYQDGSDACILALDKTAAKAIDISGSGAVTLDGCDVASNSNNKDESLYAWGSSTLSADCVRASGGIKSKGNITLTGCSGPVSNAPRLGDPFKDLEAPASKGTSRTDTSKANKNTTLDPGYYSGGMSLKGNVTLNPGTYYVEGGFTVNSNAVVTGAGVTIYLAPGANVTVNGTPTITMSAPNDANNPYNGILFYGDRDGDGENKFNGNAAMHLTGNLYFPSQQVTYQGNYSGNDGCTFVVADLVKISGSTKLGVKCPSNDMPRPKSFNLVKIVE